MQFLNFGVNFRFRITCSITPNRFYFWTTFHCPFLYLTVPAEFITFSDRFFPYFTINSYPHWCSNFEIDCVAIFVQKISRVICSVSVTQFFKFYWQRHLATNFAAHIHFAKLISELNFDTKFAEKANGKLLTLMAMVLPHFAITETFKNLLHI